MKSLWYQLALLSAVFVAGGCSDICDSGGSDGGIVWKIGECDSLPSGFALAPDGFRKFVGNDFGYEDKYFLVGHSAEAEDFPYVLPGPADTWGGTWWTSGWRTHQVNVLFGLKAVSEGVLRISLADYSKDFPPVVKVSVNGYGTRFTLGAGSDPGPAAGKRPTLDEPLVDSLALVGDFSNATPCVLEVPVGRGNLKEGGNEVVISVLEGSWIVFDSVSLECDHKSGDMTLLPSGKIFVRDICAADYEIEHDGQRFQPLIVDLEHLSGTPEISVKLDGRKVFSERVEKGRYQLEVPMPAVPEETVSSYVVSCGMHRVASGTVIRAPRHLQSPSDYVDTRIGTAHSRWMIAPGPWMPFGMVKVSPDNQNQGWQAGYQPTIENVACFSHIHEWTMSGLGIMATNGPLVTVPGYELDPDSGYRSRIDKSSEKAGIGYYSVRLSDYDILAEMTATTRCSFFRFTFPQGRGGNRIIADFDPEAEYGADIRDVRVRRTAPGRIEGSCRLFAGGVWSNDADQDYRIHFVMEFDSPLSGMSYWRNGKVSGNVDEFSAGPSDNAGLVLEFGNAASVQMRCGISLVSLENASENLAEEVAGPFGWDFSAVVRNQKETWDSLLSRIRISASDRLEKVKFYNNMYRSLCSRNIFSDVNGEWVSTDGAVRRVSDPERDVMLGCDAFWNTFWNLNQFWNLVTPEWSSKWVHSQLAMYDANGWLAKGPAGLNYIPVMVAEHEIPLIVSAWQMGIRDFDAEKALGACVKMQTTPARKVFRGFAGNRDLEAYLEHHYVPYDKGRFSNTMEYSFDDWCVGQLAGSLGQEELYREFNARGYWWKNAISGEGYCHMRDSRGEWLPDFDPYRSGANQHYVEGNAWQLTFFVPQDIPELVNVIGRDRFLERLEFGFSRDEAWRYNAPQDQYWDHPVVQGNQQSMHFSFLFNYAGAPWLTQKWSRSILDRYYGCGMANAYLGDEDQGQMSAWAVMASLGLFQTDGGTSMEPVYEIASPAFREISIDLGGRYGRGEKFVIRAKNASRRNIYVRKACLDGKRLYDFRFPASELLDGGVLELEMGPEPDYDAFGTN